MPRTAKQLAASRANGRNSRGPVTEQGKQRSSQNALQHGLTSRHLCLTHEDPAQLDSLRAAYLAEWQPATPTAHDLVEDLAATRWRLNRALVMETALLQLSVAGNRRHLKDSWTNLSPTGEVALSLDYFGSRLDRLQGHIERLRRALTRTIRLLQQLAAQNAQNEPEQAQTQTNEALSVFASLRLCEKPTPPDPPSNPREQHKTPAHPVIPTGQTGAVLPNCADARTESSRPAAPAGCCSTSP